MVAQTTTTEQAQSLLIFSEDRNIFIRFCTHRKSLFFVYCGAVFALANRHTVAAAISHDADILLQPVRLRASELVQMQ